MRRRVVRERDLDLHARLQWERDLLNEFAHDAKLRQLHVRCSREEVHPRLYERRAVHHGVRVRERRLQKEAGASVHERYGVRDGRLFGRRLLQHGLLGLVPRVQQNGLRRHVHLPRGDERPRKRMRGPGHRDLRNEWFVRRRGRLPEIREWDDVRCAVVQRLHAIEHAKL